MYMFYSIVEPSIYTSNQCINIYIVYVFLNKRVSVSAGGAKSDTDIQLLI